VGQDRTHARPSSCQTVKVVHDPSKWIFWVRQRRLVASMLVCATLATGVSLVTDAGANASRPSDAGWHTRSTFLSSVGELNDVSCADARYCLAIGNGVLSTNIVLTTDNGGATWTHRVAPQGVNLRAVTCSTPRFCAAVGVSYTGAASGAASVGVILTTLDGGASWSKKFAPPQVADLSSIACPNSQKCFATGDSGNGSSGVLVGSVMGWRWEPVLGHREVLTAISCTASSICVAVGQRESTYASEPGPLFTAAISGSGAKWTVRGVALVGVVRGISCASTLNCTMVGEKAAADGTSQAVILTTADGAKSWTRRSVAPSLNALNSVDCISATECVAVGSALLANHSSTLGATAFTIDSGRTWRQTELRKSIGGLDAISCVGRTCESVGWMSGSTTPGPLHVGSAWRSAEGAANWRPQRLPGTLLSPVDDLSCATTRWCTALTGTYNTVFQVAQTLDGGHSWTLVPTPRTFVGGQVACPSSTTCLVAGGVARGGEILRTTDDGRRWSEVPGIPRVAGLSSLSCPTPMTCMTETATPYARNAFLRSTDAGRTWKQESPPPGASPYGSSMACWSPKDCLSYLLGESIWVWRSRKTELPRGATSTSTTG
jgi:hypothetical protein